MAIISRLGVVLGLDSAEFNAGLGKAEAGVKKFESVAGYAKTGLLAIGAAFVATSYQAIQFADQMDELATANGVATSTILELSQALSTSGGKVDDVGKLLSTLTNKIDEAATGSQKTRDKFKQLGISLDDLGRLSETDLLRKTIDGLTKIEDPITRNALKFDLLGKAVRSVDINALNDSFKKLQGTMEGSDEAYAKIAGSLDKLAILSQQIKMDLANDLSEPFEKAIEAADRFYQHLRNARLENIRQQQAEQQKIAESAVSTGATWHQKLFGGFMGDAYKKANAGANTNKYVPFSDATEYKPNFNVDNTLKRKIEQTPEQIAAAKKLADEYEKQKESLKKQSSELEIQIKSIGLQQTGAEKLALEFEKGGKYARLKGTADEKSLMNKQRELDLATQQHERAKELVQQAIKKEEVERTASESRAQEVAQMAIQRMEHDRSFERTVAEFDFAKERLELEKQMAGQADVKVNKALSLFDLEKEILRLKRDDKLVTEEQIEAYRRAATARIEADEANTRAQHTFQAGWDKAYNNFAERTKDSASLGADAFNSMTRNMESALDTFVRTGKLSFKDFAASIIQDLLRIQLKAQATQLFSSLFGGFGGASSGTSGSLGTTDLMMSGIGFAADGGYIDSPTIVGERGPELFIPKTAGTVIPNHSLSSTMGQQPQIVYNGPYIANMSTIDSKSFEQRIYQSSAAVWAANAYANKSMPTTGGRT